MLRVSVVCALGSVASGQDTASAAVTVPDVSSITVPVVPDVSSGVTDVSNLVDKALSGVPADHSNLVDNDSKSVDKSLSGVRANDATKLEKGKNKVMERMDKMFKSSAFNSNSISKPKFETFKADFLGKVEKGFAALSGRIGSTDLEAFCKNTQTDFEASSEKDVLPEKLKTRIIDEICRSAEERFPNVKDPLTAMDKALEPLLKDSLSKLPEAQQKELEQFKVSFEDKYETKLREAHDAELKESAVDKICKELATEAQPINDKIGTPVITADAICKEVKKAARDIRRKNITKAISEAILALGEDLIDLRNQVEAKLPVVTDVEDRRLETTSTPPVHAQTFCTESGKVIDASDLTATQKTDLKPQVCDIYASQYDPVDASSAITFGSLTLVLASALAVVMY